jgi:hypothetical protein
MLAKDDAIRGVCGAEAFTYIFNDAENYTLL